MSALAIRVENLSKQYFIGGPGRRADSLRDLVVEAVTAPARRAADLVRGRPAAAAELREAFWALRGVSFDVRAGEVLGVIGRNGAGKSTLLKILARITEPTDGWAEIHGRVGSLLEVGTGFHPELTGRENVYLNGAILGMKRAEIQRRFDEIVAFSEVERFLDTPIKHYSSGMQMRLAFAVAAHLDPEILIVDEVLAVGDAAFQQKCLGKMSEVAGQGRTVLFVSHNMSAIEHFCERVILLDSGVIRVDDSPPAAIAAYLKTLAPEAARADLLSVAREAGLTPVITRAEFLDDQGAPLSAVPVGAALTVHIHYQHTERLRDPYFGLIFETQTGVRVFWVQTQMQQGRLPDLPPEGVIACRLPRLPLVPGVYWLTLGCGARGRQLDIVPRGCQIQVTEADVYGTGRLPPASHGLVVVDADWEVVQEGVRQ